MASITFDSTAQRLWGASNSKYDFFGRIKCDISRNQLNNTYTVSVSGIAAHCGEWNFKTYYTITLNGTTVTGNLPNSGSNTYSGWIPKYGEYTANGGYYPISLSTTVSGNSDGSCPTINLYFKCYNTSVTWITASKQISVSSTYGTTNIGGTVQSAIGKNDRSAPTMYISASDVTSSSLTFSASSNATCNDWQYQLDGGGWVSYHSGSSSANSKTISVSQGYHNVRIWANKTSNNVGGYSGYAYFDTRNPSISNPSITASSSTSAVVRFTTNFECTYIITDSSGNSLGSGTAYANSAVSKNITTPASDSSYTIYVTRTYDGSLTNSTTVPCYSAIPRIDTFTMTPVNSSTAKVTVRSNCDFQWRVKRPDGVYYSSNGKNTWSSDCLKNTDITSDIAVEAVSDDYIVEIRRAVNHNLTNIRTTSCDTRLPVIKEFSITPTSEQTANLTIVTDLPCTWVLSTATVESPSGNVSNSYSGSVTIDSEKIKPYTITVYRTNCTALQNYAVSADVDTTSCKLTIGNVGTSGPSCSFTAVAEENCRNWQCQLQYIDTNQYTDIQNMDMLDKVTKSINFTRNNVELNRKFNIIVTAKKHSNGAACRTEAGPYECTGVGYIANGDSTESTYGMYVVYINTSANPEFPKWQAAAPYVYSNGEWKCATTG